MGYAPNYPAYQVKFNIPTATPVYFAVTVTNASTLPVGYANLIKAAILAQFNGQNNNIPAGIASLILASGYYGAVLNSVPNLTLVSILVGLTASPTGYDAQIGIDQEPTLNISNISVTAI